MVFAPLPKLALVALLVGATSAYADCPVGYEGWEMRCIQAARRVAQKLTPPPPPSAPWHEKPSAPIPGWLQDDISRRAPPDDPLRPYDGPVVRRHGR